MPADYREYVNLILFGLLAVLAFFILKPFLMAILVGALVAYLCYPIYRWVVDKGANRSLTALLLCVLVFLLIVIPGVFLVKVMVQESYSFFILAKQKTATGLFAQCHNSFCQAIKEFGKNPTVASHVQDSVKFLTNWVINKGSEILFKVPRLLLNLFVMLFTMFYFLKDGPDFMQKASTYLSFHEHKYALIVGRLKEIVRGVVFGYVLVAVLQGFLGAVGFYLFGIESALVWGVVMAFLALIPFVGTGLVWVPISVVMFLNGMFQDSTGLMIKAAGLFLYCAVFVASIDNVLRPKIISKTAKVHPTWILLGALGGVFVFGPLGVVIGPLVLSMAMVVIEAYLEKT